jgi:anti-sigma regulatory factor (Ser/Thr protein kinase)
MQDLSLHILDIAENSIDAGASRIEINISVDKEKNSLIIVIMDNGRGMDEEILNNVKDPFFTTKEVRIANKKFGLGIPLFMQAAEECGGRLDVDSTTGKGTVVRAEFQLGHIDMKPLGDMGSTMTSLIAGHPEIDFIVHFNAADFSYCFNTVYLKQELDEVPINMPDVLKLIKEDINEAVRL